MSGRSGAAVLGLALALGALGWVLLRSDEPGPVPVAPAPPEERPASPPSTPPPSPVAPEDVGRFEGTVADEDGAVLEGAVVTLEPLAAPAGAIDPASRERRTATTDAAGAFAMPKAPVGEFRVAVVHGPERGEDLARVKVERGGTERRALRLARGLAIEGRVFSAGLGPIEGAAVAAWPAEGGLGTAQRPAARTDADGRFVLRGLRAGKWTIEARAADHVPATEAGVAAPGRDVVIRLTPLGSADGVVEDPDGNPFSGAFEIAVSASGAQAGGAKPEVAGRDPKDGRRHQSFPARDGTFHVPGLDAGIYLVEAVAGGFRLERPVEVVVADGRPSAPARLRLRLGAAVRGTFVERDGRRPIEGADVTVQLGDFVPEGAVDSLFHATTDADGRFSVGALRSGTYRVIARGPRGRLAEARATVAWGESAEVDLASEGVGRVEVRVLDGRGGVGAGLKVSLETESGIPVAAGASAVRTDAKGRWSADDVPAGHVRIHVDSDEIPGMVEPRVVEVPAGGRVEAELTYRPKFPGVGPR